MVCGATDLLIGVDKVYIRFVQWWMMYWASIGIVGELHTLDAAQMCCAKEGCFNHGAQQYH